MRLIVFTVCAALVLGAAAGLASTFFEVGVDTAHHDLSLAGPPPLKQASQARVEIVGGHEYNFGTMEYNSTGSHSFQLRNTGSEPLELEVGDTTCKCTVGSLERNVVPPGESVEVRLEWTPTSYAEVFRQRATILTNDPTQGEINLTIVGSVDIAVRAIPSNLSLGRITASEPHSAVTRIYGFYEEGFEIVQHKFTREESAEYFHAEIRPLREEELSDYIGSTCGYEIAFTTDPGLPLGEVLQTLEVTTNLESVAPVKISLEGEVVGDITLFGSENLNTAQNVLNLGLIRRGQARTETLYVLVKGPHRDEVALSVAEIDPDGVLQATLGERKAIGEGQVYSYALEITVPDDAPAGNHMGGPQGRLGHITLETGHPTSPQLILHVRFAVEG